MPRIEFRDASIWRHIIDSIEKIINEGSFVFNEEGLMLRALDNGRISMVDIFFPRSVFSSFEIEQEAVVNVSFEDLVKIMRRAGKNDRLILEFDDTKLTVTFAGKGVRSFRMPQYAMEYEKLPLPRIEYTAEYHLPVAVYVDAIKDVELASDIVTLSGDEETLIIAAEGDIDQAEVELSMERQTLLEANVKEPTTSKYMVSYLSNLIKAAQAGERVVIKYAVDAPVQVDINYLEGGRLTLYVSPYTG